MDRRDDVQYVYDRRGSSGMGMTALSLLLIPLMIALGWFANDYFQRNNPNVTGPEAGIGGAPDDDTDISPTPTRGPMQEVSPSPTLTPTVSPTEAEENLMDTLQEKSQ